MNQLSKEMYKNIIMNYIFRCLSIILNLVSVKLNLTYLGISLYGIWATISSVASWVNYGDLGIGNGLRNQLAAAYAENDLRKQKKLIATAVKTLGIISIVIFILLSIISEFIFYFKFIWEDARIPMYITNFFFSLDLFMGVGRSIALGYQKSWITSLTQFSSTLLKIISVLFLIKLQSNNKLLIFSLAEGISGLLGNIILWTILIKIFPIFNFNEKKEHVRLPDISYEKTIITIGLKFFVLQLCSLILYASDNLIINKVLSSDLVTKYEIINKIYSTCNSLFSILLINLWSSVTYAMTIKNYQWIKIAVKRILLFWTIYSIGVAFISFNFKCIIKIWIGNQHVIYDTHLIWLFAISAVLTSFGSIFVNVSNGLGRLKIQMCFSIIGALINIPLSVFFAKWLSMGIYGIKLATLICCSGSILFVPLDIILFLKTKGKGKD